MCVDNLKLTDRRDSDNNIIDNWVISNETRGENMSVRDTSIDPRLLDSARKEFMERGFLKAELKRICENAGVTTGAMYRHFKDKDAFFCALVDDAIAVTKQVIMLADPKNHENINMEQMQEHIDFEKKSTLIFIIKIL